MASTIMSSEAYLNYLNDYIHIILTSTDQSLLEHLPHSYFDEIESHAREILARWHSEQTVDQASSFYIENVGHLNRKIALLTQSVHHLKKPQLDRVEQLLLNSETVRLIRTILDSLLENNVRHDDEFLRYFAVFLDSFSSMNSARVVFHLVTKQTIQSNYYRDYLRESMSSSILPRHRFFLGAISRLASENPDSTLNETYVQFLQTFYNQTSFSNNSGVHYCALGILSQLEVNYLLTNFSCMSTLLLIVRSSILSNSSNENLKAFVVPILTLLNSLCIQSKTVACYLNSELLIDILLQEITNEKNSRIQLNVCLLLGHVISEKQLDQLRIGYKLTMKLLALLQKYQEEKNDILQSLLSLTVHQSIQHIIASTYQLKNLIPLADAYPIVYDILWKLSFHPDILEQLVLQHSTFVRQLPSLKTLPAAYGILQNIHIKDFARSPSKTEGESFDVALVSSSKDHETIQKIEENLRKHDLRLGRTVNTACILLCISEECKHDCSCQASIRRALLDCKKILICTVARPFRIDDWFSTLDIQTKQPFHILDFNWTKIASEIRKDLPHLPSITREVRILTPSPPMTDSEGTFTMCSSSPPPPLVDLPKRKIQSWTNREVLEWCDNNKLKAFSKILTLYDGRSLLALAHVSRMSTPHTIINQLRNDCRKQGLKVSFVEFVRFQTALDDLLRFERNLLRKQSISTLANRYVYRGKNKN